ncbi:MAG: catalase-peroxidase, partial [Sphaerochaetaceae bacterium]|nr:catalase-peroxidase [Sphaerochaetaceae bacterium]
DTLETLQKEFTSEQSGDKKISLADLIVLAGCAAVEKAASRAGVEMTVPFSPGRTDATAAQTDVQAFSVLEPKADGFRNYQRSRYGTLLGPLLLDNAQLLTLTAPEMVALRGGLRVLNANYRQVQHGVLTDRPEVLTNDFFTNILDMRTAWTESKIDPDVYEGRDRSNGTVRWTATRVDLLFGSHSQLRALAEVYGSSDAEEKFVRDFVSVWNKVMNLDRFDLADRG